MESGTTRLRVTTDSAQPVSKAFYEAHGYVPVGCIRHHNLVLQEYRKVLAE